MDVADWVRESVQAGPVQGSQLAQRIRRESPDWTPEGEGARSLRDFVDRFVDGVAVVGRSGMDVLYGIAGDSADPPAGPVLASGALEDVNLWRVWVSPRSPFALSVGLAEGSVSQVPRGATSEAGTVELEPATQEFHEEMARGFATDHAHDGPALLPLVGASDGWWHGWQRTVKSMNLESTWHEYRSRALETHLRECLERSNVVGDSAERAMAAVVRDRSIARSPRRVKPAQPPSAERALLEAVLLSAIQRMEVSDLRDLKVPVGVLLDAVADRTSL